MRAIIQRIPMRIAALPYRAIGALLHIVEPNFADTILVDKVGEIRTLA